MAEVAVIGGGPAGAVFAARMAELGHSPHLIEAAAFPRMKLGESLTPGVAPMLRAAGLGSALEGAHVRPIAAVEAQWEGGPRRRELGAGAGLAVDRGGFDAALAREAGKRGVRLHQPARARRWVREGGRWRIEIETGQGLETLHADFLADARGRGGAKRTGAPTLALYAYWRVARPPETPRIVALADGWAWGVPLPNGLYNTLVFVDPRGDEDLESRLLRRVEQGGLVAGCGEARLATRVRALDATSALSEDCVGVDHLKLGDRALALDPLSSSGVQKAIQGALSGAIVANTLLARPAQAEAALRFHREQLAEASRQHAEWAGAHYAAAARKGAFWRARARTPPESEPAPAPLDPAFLKEARLALSPEAGWRDTPCLDERFVAMAPALSHPRLPRPVAFLGGTALAPLLQGLKEPLTALDLARRWAPLAPLETGLQIAAWLAARAVLTPCNEGRRPA